MTSQIRYYGHACIEIKTPSASIVADPWFSPTGAFLASWQQFPANDLVDLESIRRADYIFISHEHEDHLDLDFLRTCSRSTVILIPEYHSDRLYNLLSSVLDQEIRVLPERKRIPLASDLTVCLVKQSVPIWQDCTIIFETEENTIVDINDMKISHNDALWIRNNFSTDYLFMQFSGANWHPAVYDYPVDKKVRIAKKKILTKFKNIVAMRNTLEARFLVPSAGPPCFLDPDLFELNFAEYSVSPTQADFYEFTTMHNVDDGVIIPLPGDFIDVTNAAELTQSNIHDGAFTQRREYLESYQERRLPYIKEHLSRIPDCNESLDTLTNDYFQPLMRSAPWLCEKINCKVRLIGEGSNDEDLLIDFTNPSHPVSHWEGESTFFTISADVRFMRSVLLGHLSWEELFLSLRLKLSRHPDQYNEHLIAFLRFANPKQFDVLKAYEERDVDNEYFELMHAERRYEVQRHCPHAGGDLAQGIIDDGDLLCPVHGWRFSLDTGECSVREYCIEVRQLNADEAIDV